MNKKLEQERIWAIDRYFSGENPFSIITLLRKSRSWLYKWIKRYKSGDTLWYKDKLRIPNNVPIKISTEIEEIVKITRSSLYNKNLFYGAQAIRWELEDLEISQIPSIRTINRILQRNDLTHRRTGKYIPKGTIYPKLPAEIPNEVHQADYLGPLYLTGPIRFYSLNVIDLATGRCGIEPLFSRNSQNSINALWSIWWRIGFPKHIQVDNALTFFGSNRHPRGMGALIRLCLSYNIEPWFIPIYEPWRNGVVEKFNEHYRQKFLAKVNISTEEQLFTESIQFENRHNNQYRYSKLNGKTPFKVLDEAKVKLELPPCKNTPKHPIAKPKKGRYHFVRLIKSDLCLNIFSEKFFISSDYMYEYVIATVDVKEQKLKIFHNKKQVEEFNYKL